MTTTKSLPFVVVLLLLLLLLLRVRDSERAAGSLQSLLNNVETELLLCLKKYLRRRRRSFLSRFGSIWWVFFHPFIILFPFSSFFLGWGGQNKAMDGTHFDKGQNKREKKRGEEEGLWDTHTQVFFSYYKTPPPCVYCYPLKERRHINNNNNYYCY